MGIVELRKKYQEMRELRLAEGQPSRERLAALAARFPGALREIDDLPMKELERRIAALSRAENDPALAAPWMTAMVRFHALARGALLAKRSLGTSAPLPEEWRDDRERVASPPRGRLMDLVYERLAREMGTSPEAAKELVFGRSRRARLADL